MNKISLLGQTIPRMSEQAIANVRAFEEISLSLPQVPIPTHHLIHAGMYFRTIKIPSGVMLTGAFITIPTVLTIFGKCRVYADGDSVETVGYRVIPASAGRKVAFGAIEDTYLTMAFPTNAKTVEAAEEEFTNEAHILMSRDDDAENVVIITGE